LVILLDDMILPNAGVHWHAAQVDVVMMVGLASSERTEDQWHILVEKAGHKINKVYAYTNSLAVTTLMQRAAGHEKIKRARERRV
jgi:hypothetical protein